jgi:hypothetical protein
MVPLKIVPWRFKFYDEAMPAELRAPRVPNKRALPLPGKPRWSVAMPAVTSVINPMLRLNQVSSKGRVTSKSTVVSTSKAAGAMNGRER